ncbi:MAG TPA: biotin--[acetyl-CoA-carboxylase] ligase [Steroidobacteraceae bacterium]|nr:biotin--[acetyl-CoA-carboxylase] ligase [Steroidobacteraceae bacterium]
MSDTGARLVRLLADGELHSGERLAATLGVTRAAVWKTIGELRERGIAIASHDRRGYRLEHAAELLDAALLRQAAADAAVPWPMHTEVVFELASTNERLQHDAAPPPGAPRLLFAEWQTAGRGRRGRAWLAPFGSGLTFSIAWTFAEMPSELSALSLAMGVCVVTALRELGGADVELKWPNDIVHRHRKLGGLLLQLRSEAGGPACVVAGLGLNLHLPAAAREALDALPDVTPVTDLAAACGGSAPARNVVAARVAGRMLEGLERFARDGFAPFAADWARFDSLRDAPVTVLRHDGRVDGTARGADREGALVVETAAGTVQRVHAGDVSLRRGGADR